MAMPLQRAASMAARVGQSFEIRNPAPATAGQNTAP
jgi:hypothetical protein